MCDVANVFAMVLKSLASIVENKDLHVQFGVILTVYVEIGVS